MAFDPIGWLTGRDAKQADVYANFDKVDQVVSSIHNVSTGQVESARSEVQSAMGKLQDAVANAGISIDTGMFDPVYEGITSTVNQIAEQLQSKANDIKTYEEATWYEKWASTNIMQSAKVAEGVLSVLEDLGDQVASVVGWIAPKDSGLEKWCTDFVKSEWSHDAFNFYYDSDFAKKSMITEDSALSGTCKLIGKTAGMLYAGGTFAGATGLSGLSAGTGFMQLSGTTISQAAIAGLTGLGSGTETGLLNGKDINEAFSSDGVKQGAIGAGLAIVGGRVGEKMSFKAGGTQVQDAANNARDQFFQTVKDNGGGLKGLAKLTSSQMDDISNTFIKEAGASNASKLGNYEEFGKHSAQRVGGIGVQGYTDSITNAGVRFGEAQRNVVQSSAAVFAANKAVKKADKAVEAAKKEGEKAVQSAKDSATKAHEAVDKAKEARASARDVLREENPVSQVTGSVKNGWQGAKNAVVDHGGGLKGVAGAAKDGIKGLPSAVKSVVTNPATPGVVSVGVGNGVNQAKNTEARTQFKTKETYTKNITDNSKKKPNVQTTPVTTSPPPEVETTTTTTTTTTSQTQTGGGSVGGGSASIDSSASQFKQTATPDTKVPTTAPTTPVTTPSTTQTTTPTTPVTTPATTPTTPITTSPTTAAPTMNTVPQQNHSVTSTGGTSETHTGGEFNASGYNGEGDTTSDLLDGDSTSIDDIIKGSKYGKIPSASKPIIGDGIVKGSAFIPIASGLSAAGAAGLGTKAYLDNRKDKDDDDDDFNTEDWSSQDSIEIGQEEPKEEMLEEDEHFDFQQAIEE